MTLSIMKEGGQPMLKSLAYPASRLNQFGNSDGTTPTSRDAEPNYWEAKIAEAEKMKLEPFILFHSQETLFCFLVVARIN